MANPVLIPESAGATALTGRSEPRWERRKQDRPGEINAAALELFVERGYAATRLEDVAARAGVSKGTVYLYFANKHELFKSVVRRGIVSPLAQVNDMLSGYRGPMMELLRLLLRGWWTQIGSTQLAGIPKLVIAEARNFPEIAEFYFSEVVQPGTTLFRRIVERGIAEGEFRATDSEALAQIVMAPMLIISLWRSSLGAGRPGTMNPERLLDTHLDLLQSALAVGKPGHD